ncbi:hypothetical protein ABW19_dt0202696 [Dactylella cylindrospora]|nr:hypothetical protein ABW19_dt0202696 [Dactylella cylindrospora]
MCCWDVNRERLKFLGVHFKAAGLLHILSTQEHPRWRLQLSSEGSSGTSHGTNEPSTSAVPGKEAGSSRFPPTDTQSCQTSSTAPDVTTFLTKIGRNMIQHESKFTDWNHFMASTPQQLREMGIEPARDRRYLIDWRERYRNGVAPTEYKRGRKIDGGERRRKMVRALRMIAEKREQRKKEEQAALMGH